jgi:hypothetical protein
MRYSNKNSKNVFTLEGENMTEQSSLFLRLGHIYQVRFGMLQYLQSNC